MHLRVERSQTLICLLWLEENRRVSLGLRARAVTGSESPSIVALMEALDESTILMESSQAHTRNVPSDDTAKGPPV